MNLGCLTTLPINFCTGRKLSFRFSELEIKSMFSRFGFSCFFLVFLCLQDLVFLVQNLQNLIVNRFFTFRRQSASCAWSSSEQEDFSWMIISRNIRISLAYKEGDDDDMNIHWGKKTAIVGFASRCCSHFWERWPVLTWSWETSIGCLKTTQVTYKVLFACGTLFSIVLSLGLTKSSWLDCTGWYLVVVG